MRDREWDKAVDALAAQVRGMLDGMEARPVRPENWPAMQRLARTVLSACWRYRQDCVADANGLTQERLFLLRWLAKDDGQLGECQGVALDALVEAGLVTLTERAGWACITQAGLAIVQQAGGPYDGTAGS